MEGPATVTGPYPWGTPEVTDGPAAAPRVKRQPRCVISTILVVGWSELVQRAAAPGIEPGEPPERSGGTHLGCQVSDALRLCLSPPARIPIAPPPSHPLVSGLLPLPPTAHTPSRRPLLLPPLRLLHPPPRPPVLGPPPSSPHPRFSPGLRHPLADYPCSWSPGSHLLATSIL